jgi:hypothetical protein
MATTYSMKLDGVQVKWNEEQFSDVVTAITYIITGISDDGIRKDWRKQIPLPLPSSPDFIPIQDLTEEIMTSWVLNSPDYITESDIRIFNIRFEQERSQPYTTSYNFPFITSSMYPDVYLNP